MVLSVLLTAFIVMPIVELALLFKVSELLGIWEAVSLVVITGVVGAFLAKAQGLMVMRQIQLDLAEGRMPAPRLMDGVMILVAGALLVTPGLITDTAGFLLLVPAVRAWIRFRLRRRLEQKLREGQAQVTVWRW